MSRVLLDENVPVGLRRLLDGHDVTSTQYRGWKGLANGRLLTAAAMEFDVFITADQNLRFQQHIVEKNALAIVVLPSTKWDKIKGAAKIIKQAVDRAESGAIAFVQIPVAEV